MDDGFSSRVSVLPDALKKFLLLTLGSSLWFFLLVLESVFLRVLVLLSSLCSQNVAFFESWFHSSS